MIPGHCALGRRRVHRSHPGAGVPACAPALLPPHPPQRAQRGAVRAEPQTAPA